MSPHSASKALPTRCDSYRPCSLCLRANAVCVSDDADATSRPERNAATDAHRLSSELTPSADAGRAKRAKRPRLESPSPLSPSPSERGRQPSEAEVFSRSLSPAEAGPLAEGDGDGEPAITIARKIHRMQSQHIDHLAVDAIPGAHTGRRPRASFPNPPPRRQSHASYLKHDLPDEDTMILLLHEYFDSVHWFSLVILESKFRVAFNAVRDGLATPSERPFLLLLSTVLGLAAWYRGNVPLRRDEKPAEWWQDWSARLLENSESRIIDVMGQNSVTAIQTMILLGSFYVYHGRPNLSFSLLGATVKAAQAAGLHREPTRASYADHEEQKRVWWTIYTWDRFASITYGRPLGVRDQDCNISQPADVFESTVFAPAGVVDEPGPICFSTYQRELNTLYTIASPAIENIYAAPESRTLSTAAKSLELVKDVTSRLWSWQRSLPEGLRLRLHEDCGQDMSPTERAHCLQSLSLQLTLDSLIIVLHRPFIKQSMHSIKHLVPDAGYEHGSATDAGTRAPILSEGESLQPISSHQQWWEAAVRTSRVTELPQLAQIATDSHLVAFLAINLFNAATVMVVVALSDPLTNNAQEAKRAVARIYRLQETLGRRSTLSKQSSRVLKSLVKLLLRRESDAILAPLGKKGKSTTNSGERRTADGQQVSVRDALSLPFSVPLQRAANSAPQETAMPDSASRLQAGLETVQRVFAADPGDNHSASTFVDSPVVFSEHATTESGYPRFEQEHLPIAQEYNSSAQNRAAPGWSDGSALNGDGLYWFWDPSWDDLYTGLELSHL